MVLVCFAPASLWGGVDGVEASGQDLACHTSLSATAEEPVAADFAIEKTFRKLSAYHPLKPPSKTPRGPPSYTASRPPWTAPPRRRTAIARNSWRGRACSPRTAFVYDIQDEPSRSGAERPAPFRQLMDSASYAAEVRAASRKECLATCVSDAQFEN